MNYCIIIEQDDERTITLSDKSIVGDDEPFIDFAANCDYIVLTKCPLLNNGAGRIIPQINMVMLSIIPDGLNALFQMGKLVMRYDEYVFCHGLICMRQQQFFFDLSRK